MRIVFMGTPEFAVPSLKALTEAGYEVIACCTQPDRPSGRGKKLTACPVKEEAVRQGIPVYQFERIRRQEGLDAMRALEPDLYVTAAFGQILSQKLLDVPKMGTVNVHASLLPKGRGAAPINWSIIEGEEVTGVTTMMTDVGVDTGDILLKREMPIEKTDTAATLTEKLSHLGAELLIETLRKMEAGQCPRTPQNEEESTRVPMLEKDTGKIDWTKTAWQIDCLVRGVDPWPGAWTKFEGGVMKVWKTQPAQGSGQPGEILAADAKAGLIVACGDGAVSLAEIQMPGAKRMNAKDYLRGHAMARGAVLGQEEA